MKTLRLLLVLLLMDFSLAAQKKNENFVLQMRRAPVAINVDGIVSENEWSFADLATHFYMMTPMDTSFANVSTDVRMAYDDNYIYLLAINYKKVDQPYMVESLRRDFVFGKNDNFLVFIDPFDDQTNGFSFGANAAGAQWDGTMYDGGKVDLNWDNKWVSEVKNYPDRWVLEMAVPFKTIRYKKGIKKWGINFSRLDITIAEKSAWAPVPRQFPSASLAYTGILNWDEEPPKTGTNISIIPYALGGIQKDYQNELPVKYRHQVGVDAKIGLTSSLNLDLTVNPDFSQVEVDRQVTNLDRFELFFPERRQFFLENGDQLSNFGYANIRPFFSRRIGLNAPILFGARVSGKINKDWRMGAMNMLTGSVDSVELPSQNFTVMALQRRVFSRSNIGFLFVNKQSFPSGNIGDTAKFIYSDYNRNIGLEYNLASQNNLWTGKAILLKSFSPEVSSSDWVHAANLQFGDRKWLLNWQHEYVGKSYNAEVGYVPRKDFIKIAPVAQRLFFSKGKLISHGPKLTLTNFYSVKLKKTDEELIFLYGFNFRNQSIFNLWTAYNYIKLLQPFDPTNSGKPLLPAGSEHRFNTVGIEYFSKPQTLFTFSFTSRYGGYFQDGQRFNFTTDLGYRFQPYVSIALSTNYNNIQMPAPWNKTIFWLIGPRIDVTFTNTLFFTAFIQYNDQQKNINVNTRFQWRYKPASDLFIVYTDNYYSTPFAVRNRAIVLKLNYWWNL